MTRLINVVPLVLLTSLLALGRRVNHLEKVSLGTETAEEGMNDIAAGAERTSLHMDNLGLQAGGLDNAAGAQGAAATTLVQQVQRGHNPFKEVKAPKVTQATGDAMAAFLKALRVVSNAVHTDTKAAARAGLYAGMEGSGNAQESKKEADAAAATLIDAETMLFEETELLIAKAFGKEKLVAYMLEGSNNPSKEKTLERVLEVFHLQFVQLEIEIVRVGFSPKDIVALGTLQSGLSALQGQVEAMEGQVVDGEEIDLTKPLLWEESAIYWGIVKVLPDFLKVKLNLLRKVVERSASDQAKAGKTINVPPKMKKRIALGKFLKAVDNMEQLMEMEAIIKKAIKEFVKTHVSTPDAYRVAKEKLDSAVKATMERLEIFDPKMKEHQQAKIDEAAVKEKVRAMAIIAD